MKPERLGVVVAHTAQQVATSRFELAGVLEVVLILLERVRRDSCELATEDDGIKDVGTQDAYES